jgi:hypothetical protein
VVVAEAVAVFVAVFFFVVCADKFIEATARGIKSRCFIFICDQFNKNANINKAIKIQCDICVTPT